ncbi:hypothetical protein ACFTUC_38885 [Streptomyces sp. NPDC056944]|uniref:hypothetical protein n=1 Tax=unclassified Streptomyces TaxID=2593676 RepID=UPI00362DE67F
MKTRLLLVETTADRPGAQTLLVVPPQDQVLDLLLGVEVGELAADGLLPEAGRAVRVAALLALGGAAVTQALADEAAVELMEDAAHLRRLSAQN